MAKPHYCMLVDANMEPFETIWTNKEGREYHCMCQIDDNHLINIIAMLRRKPSLPYPSFQGEMAQMLAEGEWLSYEDEVTNTIHSMVHELNERGLVERAY